MFKLFRIIIELLILCFLIESILTIPILIVFALELIELSVDKNNEIVNQP